MTPDVRKAFDSAEPFDLHGVVLRVDVLKLIMHRIGFFELDASGEIPSSRSHIPPTQRVGTPHRSVSNTGTPQGSCCSVEYKQGPLAHCHVGAFVAFQPYRGGISS